MRTADNVFVVETKAESALSDENVQRKQRAAVKWCDQINALEPAQRSDREWHYVLIGENQVADWKARGARASELLDYSKLKHTAGAGQDRLI